MSYIPPPEQTARLCRVVLGSISSDHYANEYAPHGGATAEYLTEQVAIAARDLTRAVDAMDPDRWPIGWGNPAEPTKLPTAWTDQDGTFYDLEHGLEDRAGNVWACVGWNEPFDGDPVPVMRWCDDRRLLPEVIERFGPLIKRAED